MRRGWHEVWKQERGSIGSQRLTAGQGNRGPGVWDIHETQMQSRTCSIGTGIERREKTGIKDVGVRAHGCGCVTAQGHRYPEVTQKQTD